MQNVTAGALASSTLVNVGTVLSVSAMTTAATVSFTGAAVFGMFALISWVKVCVFVRVGGCEIECKWIKYACDRV